jgi:hypothetical protein
MIDWVWFVLAVLAFAMCLAGGVIGFALLLIRWMDD